MSELNDPRVFFAAERTALAWTRTALTLMAFGFAIERFGLFMRVLGETEGKQPEFDPSFWFGLIFVVLGCFFSFVAAAQYRRILSTLKPLEIPAHYNPHFAFVINVLIALLALVLAIYLLVSHLR